MSDFTLLYVYDVHSDAVVSCAGMLLRYSFRCGWDRLLNNWIRSLPGNVSVCVYACMLVLTIIRAHGVSAADECNLSVSTLTFSKCICPYWTWHEPLAPPFTERDGDCQWSLLLCSLLSLYLKSPCSLASGLIRRQLCGKTVDCLQPLIFANWRQ